MKYRILLASFSCLLVCACEHIPDDIELPYDERIVVRGKLGGAIVFERTLRIDEEWTREARLRDVRASITDGVMEQPLRYDETDSTYHFANFNFVEGQEYQLVASWKGKSVRARTTKPYQADIDTLFASLRTSGGRTYVTISSSFRPRPRETYDVYLTAYNADEGTEEFLSDFFTVSDASADGSIHISRSIEWRGSAAPRTVAILVISYDWPYYEYIISSGNHLYEGRPRYLVFAGTFKSNVEGDGVGLVWGENYSRSTVQLH
jgi:hypothetical protein